MNHMATASHNISYRRETISDVEAFTDAFIDVLKRSTLGERRPIDDRARIRSMVENANLIVTAYDGDKLVGVARSVTDFVYCCYLSDLAVDEAYQRQGIGKALVAETTKALAPGTQLLLLAAPAAKDYYSHIGFRCIPNGWAIDNTLQWTDQAMPPNPL